MPELLTLKDAAERVGCSTKTLRNRIKTGELRALMKDGKHGPTYFVPEAELVRMLAMDAPGGRSPQLSPAPAPASTVDEPAGQGSSSPADSVAATPAPTVPFVDSAVLLRLTERIEQQATELGRFMAITERAETLESRERQLQAERDRLQVELAEARAKLQLLEREQLRGGRRWFGIKRKASTLPAGEGQGSSSVEAGVR
jgi:DNA-binding transcriptional MerR regulator